MPELIILTVKSTIPSLHKHIIFRICILAALYYFSSTIGLDFSRVVGFASPAWPTSGIALAALLYYGLGIWPGILIGALFANYINGAPFPVALGISLGNSIESVIGAYLLKRSGFSVSLDRVADTLKLIVFAALLSPLAGATAGIANLYLGNLIEGDLLPLAWLTWWLGDMLGILIVTPLLLILPTLKDILFDRSKIYKVFLLAVLHLTTAVLVFKGLVLLNSWSLPVIYLLYPPLMLIAIVFGLRSLIFSLFILSVISIWGTSYGYGPFIRENLYDSMLFLQSYLVITSAAFLLLATLMREKRKLELRKDELLSIASHELKTPLTTIKGYSELLQRLPHLSRSPKGRRYLKQINEQTNRLTRLINDMLDFQRVSINKMKLNPELFSLSGLLDDLVEDMRKYSPRHKIILNSHPGVEIIADRYRISQVLTNLMSNAVKFSPDAKKIDVTLKKNRRSAMIIVRDYGIGIEKKYRRKIFDRYFQSPDNRQYGIAGGLGLGLYIAAQIIRRHKGSIRVENEAGKGSQFIVSLPA